MIPAVALLGATSIYAARTWVEREVAARIDQERHRVAAVAVPAIKPMGAIVVAARALPAGAELTRASLREIPWPKGDPLQGSFSSIDKMLEGDGKRSVVSPLLANEPVLAKKITGPGQRPTLAAAIKPGYKALTVRVDDVVGVAGFITPGDHVDVLLSRRLKENEAFSDVVAQDLMVLGIDQSANDDTTKPKVARSVTLEVGTEDAQRLVVAQSVGALTLVLRPAGAARVEPVRRVTSNDLTLKRRAGKAAGPGDQATVVVIRNSTRQDYSVPRLRER